MENCRQDAAKCFPLFVGFEQFDLSAKALVIKPFELLRTRRFLLSLPGREPGYQLFVLVLPERQTSLTRQEVVKAVLQRMSFGELATHPARASSMRYHSRQPAQVGNRMGVRLLAQLVQFGQQLQQDLLIYVVGFSLLRGGVGAKM